MSFIFKSITVLVVGGVITSSSSHAQKNRPAPEPTPFATDHDPASLDPSPQPQLRNRVAVPQLIVAGNRAVERSAEKAQELLRLRRSKKTPPLYSELLRDRPHYWDKLAPLASRYSPNAEQGPALINADHEFKGITDREYGLCWGFATLLRNFLVLARYEPSDQKSAPAEFRSKAWIKFYEKKINQVLSGKVTVFPGFKNFRELSLVPELELFLKRQTLRLWASKAIHLSSVEILKKATQPMTRDQVSQLVKDLEARIARHEMPKILFSSLIPSQPLLGYNTDIHVVLAYQIERLPQGAARIYVWDINFYGETLARTPKFIEVLPNGTLRYEPWYNPTASYAAQSADLSQVVIAPENDREMVGFLLELQK